MFELQDTLDARQVTQGQVATSDTALANFIVGLRSDGIRRSGIISAFEEVPRHDFLPASLRAHAYASFPLPIACGESAAPPDFVAKLMTAMDPSGSDRILEIGTGTGYQAAVLSRVARSVVTVERWSGLAKLARDAFERRKLRNIELRHADGLAVADKQTFDCIIVNGIVPSGRERLIGSLKPGGRLFSVTASDGSLFMTGETLDNGHAALLAKLLVPVGLFAPLRPGVAKLL
jgi:protein-L-isoaspartate(D-aspartate) O-methyltransferase